VVRILTDYKIRKLAQCASRVVVVLEILFAKLVLVQEVLQGQVRVVPRCGELGC
jgi:hypothetical protein